MPELAHLPKLNTLLLMFQRITKIAILVIHQKEQRFIITIRAIQLISYALDDW